MKYQVSVYKEFSSFLAEATQIAKDKINLYNSLLDPPTRKKLQGNAFQKFLKFLIFIIRKLGWYIYVAIGGLLGLGFLGFFGGMGTLMASNPPLAVAVAILGGGGVYLIWKNKEVYLTHEKIGKRYKKDFEAIVEEFPNLEQRAENIEKLLKLCVKSICVEVFSISSDEFVNKVSENA
ncbi:hypothetical protein MTBBW1_2410003 [Desulfamplus magnetovallimortis]|uniref:Uncharacterized protein n=1 Tax=Desulfamplus magnetovallimortis TaxID=1246637 RepID=A0A1W1HEI2_9BACT|nr:hypothetical protein [Desulfamplus magnetovallimortis]SLM30785.1 hypothetical protein MTBBW1_2410003 [Desulfamplus magnetovallimortis]